MNEAEIEELLHRNIIKMQDLIDDTLEKNIEMYLILKSTEDPNYYRVTTNIKEYSDGAKLLKTVIYSYIVEEMGAAGQVGGQVQIEEILEGMLSEIRKRKDQ